MLILADKYDDKKISDVLGLFFLLVKLVKMHAS